MKELEPASVSARGGPGRRAVLSLTLADANREDEYREDAGGALTDLTPCIGSESCCKGGNSSSFVGRTIASVADVEMRSGRQGRPLRVLTRKAFAGLSRSVQLALAHVLDVHILFESVARAFAPVSGILDAAEGGRFRGQCSFVDANNASLQCISQAPDPSNVS